MRRGLRRTACDAVLVAVLASGCATPQQAPAVSAESPGSASDEPTEEDLARVMAMFLDEDHSADEWSVPQGLDVRVPLSETDSGATAVIDDPLLDALLAGATAAAPGPATVDTRMPRLALVAGDLVEVETRLARSAAWRIYEERGQRYATRMLPMFGRYQVTLNGFYTEHDLPYTTSRPSFQFRLRIRLGVGAPSRNDAALLPIGAVVAVPVEPGNQPGQRGLPVSYVGVRHGDVVVEVFEESAAGDRALTRAALAEVERALSPDAVGVSPDATPVGAPTAPDFTLRNGMQGGIYELEAWVNPGELGTLEVRAFEFTTNTPLSPERIADRSRVRVQGTADGPLQPARAEFTIYEGNWNHYYAARIELWFTPDGGEPRKLLERVYRVEGWMR
ncbi:MAG: hypothetical protein H6725_06230 [Sandaracinaceae bacterium]|nr:hypothetical protein [Sandaracinaceae bacterium]